MNNLKDLLDSKRNLRITICFLIVVIITLGFVLLDISHDKFYGRYYNNLVHDKNNQYSFTNPVLDCENVNQGETVVSQKELSSEVESIKAENGVDFISVYFRDLNNGPWVGVNEQEEFLPGSMLKTPYFISFLRDLQDNPNLKNKKVYVTAEDAENSLSQNIKPEITLTAGAEYTLGEIADRTIKYSDNTAFSILIKNVSSKYVNDIYHVLGDIYSIKNKDLSIKVKDAASFFRILYNASYLNRDLSEYALSVFAETTYNNGIVAGVPANIKVSHKFGERSDPSLVLGNKNVIQLHDCGIVYYPRNPYLLCVMTRGEDLQKQELSISQLSGYFYDKVDKSNTWRSNY